jgi:uncharacterized membrane protein
MKMINFKNIGVNLAEWIASFIGSWTFIIIQTIIVITWIILNTLAYINHYDPYPFILLNLFFSTEAAYATPLILMASINQSAKESVKMARNTNMIKTFEKMLGKLDQDINMDKVSLKDHEELKKEIQEIKQLLIKLTKKNGKS